MTRTSKAVSPKVTAATAAAAVATILVWVLDLTAGLEVPAGVEGAFVVLLTFAAGYLVRDPQRVNGPQTDAQTPNLGL